MNPNVSLLGKPLDRRSHRRAIVCILYLSYVAMLAAFEGAHHNKYLLLLAVPAFAVLALAYWTLSQLVRAYSFPACGPETRTDERQAQVRDRSFVISYQIIAAVFALSVTYGTVALDFGWWLPSTSDRLQGVLWGVVLLTMTLPSSVVAWIEPDARDGRLENDVVLSN